MTRVRGSLHVRLLLLAFGTLAAACAADSGASTTSMAPLQGPPRCTLPGEVSAAPRSVAEVVAIANALPAGADVACFLQTLARPLQVAASISFLSLQPSLGERSPRIFLAFDPLLLSVVPAGSGSKRIEVSVMHENFRSVKAEIVLPASEPFSADAPYAKIRASEGTGTVCSSCHDHEAPYEPIPGAFISGALRPRNADVVWLGPLQDETRSCDPASEPERCAILHAIFDGAVETHRFPEQMPTFGDP